VEAKVKVNLLKRDLESLNLPVKGERPGSVVILFRSDDPVMKNQALRDKVKEVFEQRLDLLNYKVRSIRSISHEAADKLINPASESLERVQQLRGFQASVGLLLAYQTRPEAPAGGEPPAAPNLQSWMVDAGSGEIIAQYSLQYKKGFEPFRGKGNQSQDAVLTYLTAPLINQIQPGSIKSQDSDSGTAGEMKIRVIGYQSIDDEEAFEEAFFRRESPFGGFYLFHLTSNTVTYQGNFKGNRRKLESELPGQSFGEFKVDRVFWYNDILELEVSRTRKVGYTEMRLFPQDHKPPNVEQYYRYFREEFEELNVDKPTFMEVEDNGWLHRANAIPFDTVLYGFIDSRADSDFFVGEELRSNEELSISWYRMGRTNLQPIIRIYDETGAPVHQFTPKNYIQVKYKIPKGQHSLLIEVADRLGAIPGDTGGYLNFHYLLIVKRERSD